MLALIVIALFGYATPSRAVAQQSTVAVNVIDHNGKLLPFEQFRAESNDHCAPNGAALVHLHAINGSAVAIDLSDVPDPAPQGCGFGVLQGGAGASAATVRLANVTPQEVAAWSKKTSIEILSVSAAIPAASAGEARSTASTRRRLLLFAVIPVSLIAGLVVGVVMYSRAQRRQRIDAARYRVAPRPEWGDPEDGGTLRERLTRGHASLPDTTTVVAMPNRAIEPRHDNPAPDDRPEDDR